MSMMMRGLRGVAIAATVAITALGTAFAADYPAPKTGMWIAKDFKFHTGEVLPELKLGYTTVGEPSGEPVLILHGTTGSAASMLNPAFAGELFGPGQPLDASRYYIILTDSIGAGTSAKPSDGLRAKFPRYNYDDMVRAQYALVTEGLGVKHLRMIIGYSMGGMHAWLWGSKYPDAMDIVVPMASQPTEMASRNWMMRRMIIDAVRNDPDWKDGDYTEQPKAVQVANVYFGIATNGGTLALQDMAPTREKADALLDARLKAPLTVDANDFMYQWDSSRDYNAAPGLDKIAATVLAINSADDERNPPETGIMDREIKRVKNGRVLLIPASGDTRGHGTLGMAKFYAKEIGELLATAPRAATAP
ncbi:homoserine O-acetyltransferase [Ancylobacter aquaticus]|uniref:Homoserine O-acetyltransferase n=1 Tax=Ancylobacter aquaticus TaxID=100 RepID=A0A4R1I9R3_ANCAQ|nr:alpha/beta fold hydrolase [Ancylobacter aquaticus]TCK31021.1 homoserine O-acetyltransferase [Ancylobacter aquaticus]